MSKLFQNKPRYMTCGIDNDVPIQLQSFLWNCIEEWSEAGVELDYLQVFDLTSVQQDDKFLLTINHSQEVPEHSAVYTYITSKKLEGKIFVIDDGDQATILWSTEY